MYINNIDNLLDLTVDIIYQNVILKNKKILEEIYKTKNFSKYEKEINNILQSMIDLINMDKIKTIVKKPINVELIYNIIKKYCGFYLYLNIGLNYKNSPQLFNNNLIEMSKSKTKVKINDFYITETNSQINNCINLFKELINSYMKKSKITVSDELEQFIKSYGIENINKLEKYIHKEKKEEVRTHNLIKIIIFTKLHTIKEKEELFKMIEDSENTEGEFIFIDVVIPKHSYIDYFTIENVLTPKEIENGLHKTIYEMINKNNEMEMEHTNNYYSNYNYKVKKLIENNILIPIVDDFLMYNKSGVIYDKHQDSKDGVKKKEDTKLKYIVDKINNATEYYKNPKEFEKLFYKPFENMNVILTNNLENYSIMQSIKSFIKMSESIANLYDDFEKNMTYTYVSYKDFANPVDGFFYNGNNTNDVIRYVSFNEKIKNRIQKTQVRVCSKNMSVNIVGFAIQLRNIDLNCTNITQYKNITNEKNILHTIHEILKNKIEFKYRNKKSENVYFLFDLDKQQFNINQFNTLDKYNNNAEMIVAYLYDYYIVQLIKFLYKTISKSKKTLQIPYYISLIDKFIYKFPDLLNTAYAQKFSNLMNLIYEKINIEIDKYDENEDIFYGINGTIYDIPKYKYEKKKEINKLLITTRKVKKIELINISDNTSDIATCQHIISWKSLNQMNTNEIYEFLDRFVEVDSQGKYMCKSCYGEVDVKKYIAEPTYNKKQTQNFHTIDIRLGNLNLDEINEYKRFKPSIKFLDLLYGRIGDILNIKSLIGNLYLPKVKRQILIKNTIDLLMQQTQYATKTNYTANRSNLLQNYGFTDNTLYSFFIFEFENTIFTKSSTDEDLFKMKKYNTIIAYMVILLIIDMDETQMLNLDNDKVFNFLIFKAIYEKLFKKYKIIINKNKELDFLTNYTILCYLIYLITGFIIKYNIFQMQNLNITEKHKILINIVIEYLNLFLSVPSEEYVKNNIYTYEVLQSKFYLKFKLFNNIKLYETLNKKYTEITKQKEISVLFETIENDFVMEDNIQNKYEVGDIYKIAKVSMYRFSNQKYKPLNNNICYENNCPSGEFHNFNSKLTCTKCGYVIGEKSKEDIKENTKTLIENYDTLMLKKLATNYCINGKVHLFKNEECIFCHYIKNSPIKLEMKDLLKMNENILNEKKINNELKLKNYAIMDKKIQDETEIGLKYINKLIEKYKKNGNSIYKSIDLLLDSLQEILGLEIIIDENSINLLKNTYKIIYNYNGDKFPTPYVFMENDKNITITKNHSTFSCDVIIFSITSDAKYDFFYNLTTKIFLGYRKSGKEIIKIKNKSLNIFETHYSVKNMLLFYGLKSLNPSIINYYDTFDTEINEENYNMNDFINKIGGIRYENIINLLANLKKYVSRFKNKFKIKLEKYSYSTSVEQTRKDYEMNYYNNKIDVEYYYSLKYFEKYNLITSLNEHNFLKYIFHIKKYFNYSQIVEQIKFSKNIDPNYILEYDSSTNIVFNYLIIEIQKLFDVNKEKNIKTNLASFFVKMLYHNFNNLNEDVLYSNHTIGIFSQELHTGEIYHEIMGSVVVNESADFYGLTTDEEIEELDDETKAKTLDEKDDIHEEEDAMDKVDEEEDNENMNEYEFD